MVASCPKVIIWAAASLQNLHHLWPKGYHGRKKTGLFTCNSIAPLQLGIHFKPCTPLLCWPFATFALNGIKQLNQVVGMWIQGVIVYIAFSFHPEYSILVSFLLEMAILNHGILKDVTLSFQSLSWAST